MSNFRDGFLFGLAESGVTPEEFGAYLLRQSQKQAAAGGGPGVIVDPGNWANALGSIFVDLPLLAGIGIPTAAGAVAGAGLYGLSKPSDSAMIKSVQDKQLSSELKAQILAAAQRIKRRAAKRPEIFNDPTHAAITPPRITA